MANISSYNQLSSWNEDDDLLFVQQPDAPKKAHPSQMKEYILEGLDVPSVGGAGKYISAISEADGKISATAETMDEVPTQDSNKPVKSGGVFNAIDDSVSLKTATGNPITLTDAANANSEELSMTIEPVQSGSGDPSPTNVRPISGISEAVVTRTGKNLFGNLELNKSISQATGEDIDDPGGFRTAGKIRTDGYNAITLTFLGSEYKGSFIVLQYSDSGYIGVVAEIQCTSILYPYNKTLTLNPETTYIRIKGWYGANVSSINTAQFQVTLGSTASAYEPYTGATATITFGQTVYGGSVNFKTGEVTVTHRYITVGDMLWSYDSASTRFGAVLSDMKYVESLTALPPLKCSAYKPLDITSFNTGVNNAIRSNDGGSKSVWIRDTRYTDATSFKTAMASTVICYELATPTTLTPTPAELELLKGNNTITANGAEISIEYYPDNAIGTLAGRVDNKADITYVDNVVDGVVKHVAGELSITIPLSDSWTVAIFGTISVTPISAILTVVSGGNVSVTDLTSNSLASRADISVSVSDKTITLTSKNTDKFYVNIVY